MPEYIDADGESVGPGGPRIAIALRDDALERYLVVNLGYASIRRLQAGYVVKIRPSIVTGATLAGILYSIADLEVGAVTLDCFGTSWQRRWFISFASFAAFIGAIQASRSNADWLGQRHLRLPVPLAATQFAAVEQRARMIAANVHAAPAAVTLLSRLMPARWSICALAPSQTESVLLAKTANYTPYSPSVFAGEIGLSHYADRAYGRAIVELHARAVETMKPRVDHVDAVARFDGLGDIRMRYESLTLPVRRTDGSTVLVCGSCDDTSIDLRQPVNKKAL